MSAATYAEFKRVNNARVARERDGRRGRELAALAAAGLPVALALLAYTGFHLETIRTGYRIEQRRREVSVLLEARQKQMLALAAATSPERIAEVASRQKLAAARPGQLFYLAPEKKK